MPEWELYLRLGFAHITDWEGYDHMLFLLALCGAYPPGKWKPVLVLVTAFTLGHSLTLALTALGYIPVHAGLIEFLIPTTILLSAVGNLVLPPRPQERFPWLRYALALSFGLIHGMGFSNYFRGLLGATGNLLQPLLLFNLGVELGQVCIVVVILGLAWATIRLLRLPPKAWRAGVSLLAGGLALWMMWERSGGA